MVIQITNGTETTSYFVRHHHNTIHILLFYYSGMLNLFSAWKIGDIFIKPFFHKGKIYYTLKKNYVEFKNFS